MERSRNGRSVSSAQMRARGRSELPARARQRALCIAALPQDDDLEELSELLRTAGVATVGTLVQRRDHPHANTYLGSGKVRELRAIADACDANLIACDDELSARQERNLEEAVGLPVIDRTSVILDIFASHAASAEGKLQVELAQLEYNLARMRGLWSHLERLGGGIGTRGPGETQIETDRRLARDRIATLRRRLEHVKGTRAVQRAERERAALPTVALVGYTNAGKSTLLNALTGSEVGVRDRLFPKVDPLEEQEREELRLRYPDAVLVSGVTGEGLAELGERIELELAHTLRSVELLVPYAEGGSLAELHDIAGEVSREDTADGVRVRALVPARLADRFSRFAPPPRPLAE